MAVFACAGCDAVLTADTFGHTLDALLPPGPPAKEVVLAGPGLPATDADIALVPPHPLTGKAWEPSGVPLAAEVWLRLAFHHEELPVPATGGLPDGVLRDDPLPLWLREIYDQVRDHPYAHPF